MTAVDAPGAVERARLEIVRAAYAALNRGDVPGFLRHFHPALERVEPPGFPGAPQCHGLDAFGAHVARQRANWAEGACEPQRFVVEGERVVAFVRVRVRLKDESEWREGDIADAFAFSGLRIEFFRTFLDIREAMDWAGAEAPSRG